MTEPNGLHWAVTPDRKWRFHLVRGARCLEVGDFAGAQRHFGAAHRDAPTKPIVCLAWGRELLRSGELDAAGELLRYAWCRDRSLESAGFSLARLLGLHQRKWAEAQAVLDEVEQVHGASASLVLLRAELTIGEPARFPEARRFFEHALELGADRAVVKLGMARVHNAEGVMRCRDGEHHRALFALKRAADLDPGWSGPLVNSGAIFEQLGLVQKARTHYRSALRLDPVNPVALFNLAESLRRGGFHGDAVRLYRRLLALQPGYPGALDGLKQARRRTRGAQRPVQPSEPEP
jgi:Flp pilus assembly protein TadD